MNPLLALIYAELPLIVFGLTIVVSLIVGSFLNVVIYRLPIMMEAGWREEARAVLGLDPEEDPDRDINLFLPNSHCPNCQHELRVRENIPVVSYLFLRGKCSSCGTPISFRYPAVELGTAILSCTVIAVFGLSVLAIASLIFTWSLIAIALIDYDHKLIPDAITLPFLWLGLLLNQYHVLISGADAIWGAIGGYMILWAVAGAFGILTGKEGMGRADFKLLAMLGAWLGWQALPLIIILSSFTGAIVGGALIVLGRSREDPIPFGPFLALAGLVTLLWGDVIVGTYLQLADFTP